ncbi:MAG: hypothetical protein KBT48_02700, partial [Firmicutes bacterium]|nr:hypothetical protein [Bacillota bacterium]
RLLMKDNKKAEKLFNKAADKLFNDFKLKPMKKFIFRKFLNKTIYIYSKTKYYDGVLAFGYVDHEKGLCFRILCPATFNKEEQAFGNPFKDVTFTYKELESYSFLEMDYRVPGPVAEHINPIIDEVYNAYSTNPDLHELRYTVDIDAFRNKYHLDLIEVTLQDNKKILARTETIEDGYIVVSTGKDRFKIEVNKGELLPLID